MREKKDTELKKMYRSYDIGGSNTDFTLTAECNKIDTSIINDIMKLYRNYLLSMKLFIPKISIYFEKRVCTAGVVVNRSDYSKKNRCYNIHFAQLSLPNSLLTKSGIKKDTDGKDQLSKEKYYILNTISQLVMIKTYGTFDIDTADALMEKIMLTIDPNYMQYGRKFSTKQAYSTDLSRMYFYKFIEYIKEEFPEYFVEIRKVGGNRNKLPAHIKSRYLKLKRAFESYYGNFEKDEGDTLRQSLQWNQESVINRIKNNLGTDSFDLLNSRFVIRYEQEIRNACNQYQNKTSNDYLQLLNASSKKYTARKEKISILL